ERFRQRASRSLGRRSTLGIPRTHKPGRTGRPIDLGPTKENLVSTRTYRPLQMHRIPWSDLTESQVTQALRPAASGPGSKSTLSNALAGKRLKSGADEGGPTLEYNFRNGRELELSENGGKAVKAGYGALENRSLVLVS